MPGELNDSATITAETMVCAFGIHNGRRQIVWRLALLFLCAYLLISGLLMLQQRQIAWGTFFIGCSGMFAAVALLRKPFLRKRIKKQYAQMGRQQEIVSYQATADSLRIHATDLDRRLEWKKIHKWREKDGLLLLYEHDQFFHVVPISQLAQPLQKQIRDQLVGAHRG